MLMVVRNARDMLMKMSYKGFEIKDDKDLLKCLFFIITDYLGSIFHDKDNQQETIFHHLARGIPYTLDDNFKRKKGLGRIDDNHDTECGKSSERCQASLSSVKLMDTNNDADFDELTISFDLTNLSYASSLLDDSNHVIFLETEAIYPVTSDLLCKYIYYRTNQSEKKERTGLISIGTSHVSTSSEGDKYCDRIEMHRLPEGTSGDDLDLSVVTSLPVKNAIFQRAYSNHSLLRSIVIPKSSFNIEIGQKYCLRYLNGERTVLGQSKPFQFDTSPCPQSSRYGDPSDSDEDGFVIVEP